MWKCVTSDVCNGYVVMCYVCCGVCSGVCCSRRT